MSIRGLQIFCACSGIVNLATATTFVWRLGDIDKCNDSVSHYNQMIKAYNSWHVSNDEKVAKINERLTIAENRIGDFRYPLGSGTYSTLSDAVIKVIRN